jgi:TolB-like protein
VAVVPFTTAGDPDLRGLANRLAAEVTRRLGEAPDVKPATPDAVAKLAPDVVAQLHNQARLKEAGGRLGVRSVALVILRQKGEVVSLHVELLDVEKGKLTWEEDYSGEQIDQIDAVARTVAEQIRLHLPR